MNITADSIQYFFNHHMKHVMRTYHEIQESFGPNSIILVFSLDDEPVCSLLKDHTDVEDLSKCVGCEATRSLCSSQECPCHHLRTVAMTIPDALSLLNGLAVPEWVIEKLTAYQPGQGWFYAFALVTGASVIKTMPYPTPAYWAQLT